MNYEDASDTRASGVATKAVVNPHLTKQPGVDRSYSHPSHATAEHDNDYDAARTSGRHGPSNHRHGRTNDLASHFKKGEDLHYNDTTRSNGRDRGGNRDSYQRNQAFNEGRHSRPRSRSPYRSTHRRDRSRSPYRRDRSRSPYRRDRSRSPYRRDRSRSPFQRDRSLSPYHHDARTSRNGGRAGNAQDRALDSGRRSKFRNDDHTSTRNDRGGHSESRRVKFENVPADNSENSILRDEDVRSQAQPLSKEDEDARIAARRQRMAAIRAKYATNQAKESSDATPVDSPKTADESTGTTPKQAQVEEDGTQQPTPGNYGTTVDRMDVSMAEPPMTSDRYEQPSIHTSAESETQNAEDQRSSPNAANGPDTAEDTQASPVHETPGDLEALPDVPEGHHDYTSINELGDHRRSGNIAGEAGAADYEARMRREDDDRLQTRLLKKQQPKVKPDSAKHQEEPDEDDFDDMFAFDSPTEEKPRKTVSKTVQPKLDASLLVDDIDDNEGYMKFRAGMVLDGRYEVTELLGMGMFANVMRARDLNTGGKTVAVKLLRNNAAIAKSSATEVRLLQKLNEQDPNDRMHIVRLLGQLDYKNHLCMVFEDLSMNLRDVLTKFGRDRGLHFKALRIYTQQLFKALYHLKFCKIIHADLKPDNILVSHDLQTVKICDFGTGADTNEPLEITAYLASRYYRAPEVIIGMVPDYPIDMWAIGCTLYELYTGKILFTGRSNNQMLKMMMECKGHFSLKFLKKGTQSGRWFDDDTTFTSEEHDPKLHMEVRRKIAKIKVEPGHDIPSRIRSVADASNKEEIREAQLFGELVDKCLTIVPERRITPESALKHPFIQLPRPLKFGKQHQVAQPAFKPTSLLGGSKPQTKFNRKRPLATDYVHDGVPPSPSSYGTQSRPMTPNLESAPPTPVASAPPAAQEPPKKKGFKKARMDTVQ